MDKTNQLQLYILIWSKRLFEKVQDYVRNGFNEENNYNSIANDT